MTEIGEVRTPSIASLGNIDAGQLNVGYATQGLINRRYFADPELRKAQFEQIELGLKRIKEGPAGQAQELAAMVSKFQLNRTVTHRATETHKARQAKPKAKVKQGNGHAQNAAWSIDPEAIIPMDDDPDFASF